MRYSLEEILQNTSSYVFIKIQIIFLKRNMNQRYYFEQVTLKSKNKANPIFLPFKIPINDNISDAFYSIKKP